MASVNWQKMTKQTAGAMKRHNGKKEREVGNHTNKHIDKSKSHLNLYIGADDYNEMYSAMLKRVDEVDKLYPPLKKLKADERVICESLECKCPQAVYDLGYEAAVKFFNDVHKIYIIFFGAENVHGSCIHFDEIHDYVDPKTKHTYTSLPHAHSLVSCYVEWEEDIKKGGKKTGEKRSRKGINGKNFEKRDRYNKLNKIIDDYCLKEYGIHFLTGEQAKKKTVELLKSESELAETNLKVEAAKQQLISEQREIEKLRDEHEQYRELKVSKENLVQNIKVKSGGIFGSKEETVTLNKADFDTILEQSTAYVANYDKIKFADERLSALEEREKKIAEAEQRIEEERNELRSMHDKAEAEALKMRQSADAYLYDAKMKQTIAKNKRDEAARLYNEQENINNILQNTKDKLSGAEATIRQFQNERLDYEKRINDLQTQNSSLQTENSQLKSENNTLQDKIRKLKDAFVISLRRMAIVSNCLKYVFNGFELSDSAAAYLEATHKYAKDTCDKAPNVDTTSKDELNELMRKGYRAPAIADDGKNILKRIKEEREMEHTHGMSL